MAKPSSSYVLAASALLASLLCTASLLLGADFLGVLLPGGLPLGNLIAAAVFCGIASAAMLLAAGAAFLARHRRGAVG